MTIFFILNNIQGFNWILIKMKNMVKHENVLLDPYSNARWGGGVLLQNLMGSFPGGMAECCLETFLLKLIMLMHIF